MVQKQQRVISTFVAEVIPIQWPNNIAADLFFVVCTRSNTGMTNAPLLEFHFTQQPTIRLVVCFCALIIVGCGNKTDQGRIAVNGAVIEGDYFIGDGTIRFLPQAGNNGPIALTDVKDGFYHFSKQDGPYPGNYKVIINLEIDLEALSKISKERVDAVAPKMSWEENVAVPKEGSATINFLLDVTKADASSKSTGKIIP